MCRLEARSPGLGGLGTGSVRAVLMPAAVASSRMLRIRCRAWLACSAIVTQVATWREGAKLPFKLLRRSDGRWRWPVIDRAAAVVFGFLAFTKYLGRIETRIRNKKYLGWMRSVRAISRGD